MSNDNVVPVIQLQAGFALIIIVRDHISCLSQVLLQIHLAYIILITLDYP